jgi:Ca2+-binding RTX toxin-like protein
MAVVKIIARRKLQDIYRRRREAGARRGGIVATAGAFGVAALVWAAVAIADEIDCNGGGQRCNGTQFDDFITGSSQKDAIKAKDGQDDTYAGKGNDTVEAGDGQDYVEGGKGDDKISGGDGPDVGIVGGLFGGPGGDIIEGGDEDDDIYGGTGKDVLTGGPGNDQLDGIEENLETGTTGNDKKDRFSCGPGFDTVFVDSKDDPPNDCEDVVPER